MNGLLHRMAARAAGTAVAVRSDARLAYAGAGTGHGEAGEVHEHLPSASATRPRGPETPPADLSIAADAVRTRPSRSAALDDVDAGRDPLQTEPNATFVPHADPERSPGFDEPRPLIAPVDAAPFVAPAVPAAMQSVPEVAIALRVNAAATGRAARADEPAPLMPRGPRPSPLASSLSPAVRRGALTQGAAATQSEPDTEVHIHIGRIDVTAVHEAPAPRRRAAAAPAPMSLDGYLAKRGRS